MSIHTGIMVQNKYGVAQVIDVDRMSNVIVKYGDKLSNLNELAGLWYSKGRSAYDLKVAVLRYHSGVYTNKHIACVKTDGLTIIK